VFSHEWSKHRYTVAEPPCPPASQPDPSKTEDSPAAVQRRLTKAAKPGSRATDRDAAIQNRLDKGERPGSTVTWMKFCDSIRTDCGAVVVDVKKRKFERGFSDERIKHVTRQLMKSYPR